MRKILVVLAVSSALTGCDDRHPKSEGPTDNADYSVALVFEHDGCKIYRFYDKSEYRYFVRCATVTTAVESGYTEYRYNAATKTSQPVFHPQTIATEVAP